VHCLKPTVAFPCNLPTAEVKVLRFSEKIQCLLLTCFSRYKTCSSIDKNAHHQSSKLIWKWYFRSPVKIGQYLEQSLRHSRFNMKIRCPEQNWSKCQQDRLLTYNCTLYKQRFLIIFVVPRKHSIVFISRKLQLRKNKILKPLLWFRHCKKFKQS
jgi:hypothetical protein